MNPDLLAAIGSLASVAVAVIAAVVAFFAWKTAQHSASATAALTAIEKARWHADNRPEFQLEVVGLVEENDLVACNITLTGSKSLIWIDIVASVRHRTFGHSDSDTDFGPYLWDPESDYYDNPVDTAKFRLHVGADQTLYMKAAPGDGWEIYSLPIRLWLHCTAGNGDTWMVPVSCRLTPLQLSESIITRKDIEAQAEAKWGG
ncbi:hypothetical protein AB0I85_30455 [Micromonospora echinofusca]|uniref:hypothetical protein n=1 Tax=Micromonospora echinofusca TaxID=47858 RepID=UPI0033D2B64E